MKFLVVLAVAVACAASAAVPRVVGDEAEAPIVNFNYDLDPNGSYSSSYETANGISSYAEGKLKNVNSDYAAVEVDGGYKYTGPDGVLYQIVYKADENGFQPQGAHLPVAPETPAAIVRALEYIAAHPPKVQSVVPARSA